MIPVTKSFMPERAQFDAYMDLLWDSRWLTNRGSLVQELEERICLFHDSTHCILMNNGTIPIQIALKTLCKKQEVITTPFTYVATTAAIVWEGYKPVFVDIERNYLTIDPKAVEAAITKDTGAILATHVYGQPCDVEALEAISVKHNIPVIYDGAHAYGVKYQQRALLSYGTVSTTSFHATKLFHTGEGGALFCQDANIHDAVFHAHNFGHDGTVAFHGLGINGKMSEINAAMGLCVFDAFPSIIQQRKRCVEAYDRLLEGLPLQRLTYRSGTTWNYSYYPIFFGDESSLIKVERKLNETSIFPRRYFYPSMSHLPYVDQTDTPIAEAVSKTVMCMPLYHDLTNEQIDTICQIIKDAF